MVSTANAALPDESIPSLTMIVVCPIRWASARAALAHGQDAVGRQLDMFGRAVRDEQNARAFAEVDRVGGLSNHRSPSANTLDDIHCGSMP